MFIDRVKLHLLAGKGGNGVVSWRREKYVPKGGPCGGNGGVGGSIILEVDEQIPSLDWFRHRKILKAETGRDGGSNNKKGRNGKDLVLKIPCGTLIKDEVTGEVLYDLKNHNERVVLCRGGRGGRGNTSFKTSTNRAPNYCTPGKPGEDLRLEFELKLIADVGLVGFPNAGKSTLIQALADVPVKIAAYPFTTLRPNIGYIERDDLSRVFIADIPGIIQDAHKNRGLGFEFLRHIERTKLLLFVLDASGIDGRNPADDYGVLCNEIGAYERGLLERPYFIVLNKIDTEESAEHLKQFYDVVVVDKDKIFEVSALTGEGLEPVSKALKSF